MTPLAALVDSARRLLLILAFVTFVVVGAILGALRELLRAPLAWLHRWLGRILATLCIALLMASCGAPRSKAHLVGTYAGEGVPTVTFRMECLYDSTSDFGQRWLCSAPGAEGLWVRWQILDAEGRLLWSADGTEGVPVVHPAGAATLQVLVPAALYAHTWVEGGRVWRVAHSRALRP